MTVHARGACREIYYSLSGAVGLLSVLSGVGAVGTVERLSGSCRVWVSECRARAQGRGKVPPAFWAHKPRTILS